MIEEIVSAALLGTRHSPPRRLPLPEELAATLPSRGASPELELLDAAAAVTLHSRAGAKPSTGITAAAACPPDKWPECSAGATLILELGLERGLHPLVIEWLELAAQSRRRPPHRLLPRLLEAAVSKPAWRPALSAVLDERGRWLAQFNPRWQFASPWNMTAEEIWQLGTRQQRADALRAMRSSDAAKARQWVASVWKDDSADERVEWLGCLQIGLSAQDEAFLETCLDDRSSRVREAAADLLARLPTSALVKRMIERVSALVAFTPGSTGSVLKLRRQTKARLEVLLPSALDPSIERDGIAEKPREAVGPRQWWIMQMIGYVPLEYWTQTFHASAGELVGSLVSDYANVVLRGWLRSMARRPVVEWIEPLLEAAGEIRLEPSLLAAVEQPYRAQALAAMLKRPGQRAAELSAVLDAWRPLDQAVSQLILEAYELQVILACDAHLHLHTQALDRLMAILTSWNKSGERRRVDHVLAVVGLRRDMHRGFAR